MEEMIGRIEIAKNQKSKALGKFSYANIYIASGFSNALTSPDWVYRLEAFGGNVPRTGELIALPNNTDDKLETYKVSFVLWVPTLEEVSIGVTGVIF